MLRNIWLLAAAAMIVGLSAQARPQVYRLNYGDQMLQGQTTLQLKQDLRAAYPNLRVNQMEILRVQLVAKSRQGQGRAILQVGNWASRAMLVPGTPFGWNSPALRSFSTIDFVNRGGDSQGVWQLDLQGNIKVRQVAVVLDDRGFGPGDPGDPGFPGGNSYRLDCASWNNQVAYCDIDGARIVDARLIRQHSGINGPCVPGNTFGVYQGNLWVSDGCHGTFEVRVR